MQGKPEPTFSPVPRMVLLEGLLHVSLSGRKTDCHVWHGGCLPLQGHRSFSLTSLWSELGLSRYLSLLHWTLFYVSQQIPFWLPDVGALHLPWK
jgi:hypothetical protein